MGEVTIAGKLPHLDVEMTREEPGPGRPEVITMRLTATPSMDAFADHLSKTAGLMAPFGALAAMNPFLQPENNPMLMWTKMMQDAWAPFLPGTATGIDAPKDEGSS
jgi:hypothetical protein